MLGFVDHQLRVDFVLFNFNFKLVDFGGWCIFFFLIFIFIKSVVAVEVCCPGDVVSCSSSCVWVCVVVDVWFLQQLTSKSAMWSHCFMFSVFLPSLFILANFTYKRVKCIINTHSCLGRCFNKGHSILFGNLQQDNKHHIKISIKIDNIIIIIRSAYNSCLFLTSLAWFISTAHACKSHLLPTSTIGTSSASLTRFICSRYVPLIYN